MQVTLDPWISEWGNPAAWMAVIQQWRRTRGTETSHYPQEKKTTVIPPVVASERGRAQTGAVSATPGSWDRDIRLKTKCNYLER